jgi:hypothetical protein
VNPAGTPLTGCEHDPQKFIEDEVDLRLVIPAKLGTERNVPDIGAREQTSVVVESADDVGEFVYVGAVIAIRKQRRSSESLARFACDSVEHILRNGTSLGCGTIDTHRFDELSVLVFGNGVFESFECGIDIRN